MGITVKAFCQMEYNNIPKTPDSGDLDLIAWIACAPPLRLASASPRRLALLRQVGLEPEVWPVQADETPHVGEDPALCAERLAREKVALARAPERLILGADTVVALGGEAFGKPEGAEHARAMLARLSGRAHAVTTGMAACWGNGVILSRRVTTEVRFRVLSPAEIEAYVNSGEGVDKAGGYAIQGLGALLVAEVGGSCSGVVGLPLVETLQLLREACPPPVRMK